MAADRSQNPDSRLLKIGASLGFGKSSDQKHNL
ncbi:hypothetical protein Pse7367_1634 [Thalassoporum mexicanum PCC 7367]|nr:hypothetical protein Pse7367_1634 [Pseudanabaena sp. PCC 7367]